MRKLIAACEGLDRLSAERAETDEHLYTDGKCRSYESIDKEADGYIQTIVDVVMGNRKLLKDLDTFIRSTEVVVALTGTDDEEPEHSAADVFEAVCNLGSVPDLSEL